MNRSESAPRQVRPRTHRYAAVVVTAATLLTTVGATSAVAANRSTTRASDLPAPTRTHPRYAAPHATPGTVVGVRVGRHRDYDRVVFDVRGGLPGWDVRYVPQLVQDGSGRPLPLRGSAVLRVALLGVDAHDASGRPTLRSPQIITPEFPALRQVRFAGDFEAVVSFGLGLRERTGFRVFGLANPTRVVVDVAHPPRHDCG